MSSSVPSFSTSAISTSPKKRSPGFPYATIQTSLTVHSGEDGEEAEDEEDGVEGGSAIVVYSKTQEKARKLLPEESAA